LPLFSFNLFYLNTFVILKLLFLRKKNCRQQYILKYACLKFNIVQNESGNVFVVSHSVLGNFGKSDFIEIRNKKFCLSNEDSRVTDN
jgi:hypothetical protein